MTIRASRRYDNLMRLFPFRMLILLIALFTSQGEAAGDNNTAPSIGPAVWPPDSLQDPYHRHSGHVLQRPGSMRYDELDLLNILNPSIRKSDIHLNGTLYHVTSKSSSYALTQSSIVLMSCDNHDAGETFLRICNAAEKPKAIIFYTTQGNCCVFDSPVWRPFDADKPILFTFANMQGISPPDVVGYSTGMDVDVEYWAQFDADNGTQDPYYEQPVHDYQGSQRSSTMLIVYIIVALISAGFVSVMLFLGIKAFRRYGGEPTEHLRARPRQSRARGIARAALDALPVVKFGIKPSETVSKDIEMQDGASSLGAKDSTLELRSDYGEHVTHTASPLREMTTIPATGMLIQPTEPLPVYTSSGREPEPPGATEPDPNQLRCPVCLDDFEENQDVRVLPCSHSFHTYCIDPWLLNVAGSCPLCRIDLRSPEEQERDRLANILPPPPPPALTSRPRSSSVRSGRLQSLLDVAMGNSSRDERLAALRAVRNASGGGQSGPVPRSRRPELGVSRLRRAVFGDGASGNGSESVEAVTREPSLRTEDSRSRLAEAGAIPSSHSPSSSSSTAGLR